MELATWDVVEEQEIGRDVERFGDRRWRVRGLPSKPLPGSLRVNVFCTRDGSAFHVDTLELYSVRQRAHFTKLTSDELSVEERVIKRDLGEVLLKLEEFLEKRQKEAERVERRELTQAEQKEALELLRDPKLLDRILEDFERAGVVSEATNKLVSYLAATSRKLDQPLAVVIQSSSAAGKSSLMDAVLELMPEEERVQYSAMTGQSLFYMGETNLWHKILAIWRVDALAARRDRRVHLLLGPDPFRAFASRSLTNRTRLSARRNAAVTALREALDGKLVH